MPDPLPMDFAPPKASLLAEKLGNYEVQALIGRGAMGTVYLARDTALGRPVALKVLLGSLARNPEQVRRFLREAKAAAPLVHPNIVRIYEAGIRDGVPFIAMELIEGEALDRFLARTGPLPWQQALHITQQVAQALDCAHRAGVVHRDVKPANILLDRQGRVRLTDFGIARVLDREGKGFTTHECLGTPEYMSPEQCANAPVGPASDLFSLGVTLYVMLAGRAPFQASTHVALLQSIVNEPAARLNQIMLGIPDDVARLVAHLLEKSPEARPASAAQLVAQIERLQREDGGASAMPEALRRFILEECRPRDLARTQPPTRRKKIKTRRLHAKHNITLSPWARLAMTALLLLTVAALAYWRIAAPLAQPEAAPIITDRTQIEIQSDYTAIPLPAPHWETAQLRWAPDSSMLIAEIRGRAGTAAQGERGLLALDPTTRSLRSLLPPHGPMSSPEAPRWPHNSPLAFLSNTPAALLVAARRPADPRTVYLLAQHLTEATPRQEILARFEADAWGASSSILWNPGAGAAVVHPAANRICALVHEPDHAADYLLEQDLRWGTRAHRLTAAYGDLRPEDLQYTPDGDYIAYVRQDRLGEATLWLVASGGYERDGRPIAVGTILPGSVALDRAGDRAAIALLRDADDEPETVVFSLPGGDPLARLGSGRCGPQSWCPGEDALLITARENGPAQVYRVPVSRPESRQCLTAFPQGVTGPAAASPDGRRIAVATADTPQRIALLQTAPRLADSRNPAPRTAAP